MLDDIDKIPEIDEHIIITNHKFAQIFEDWAMGLDYSKKVTIVDDGTLTNETRLGAVCDHTTMYAWPMAGTGENLRFDIGSIDTYYEACEKFGEK